ncbi:hypothetical protein BJX63DRAFT_423570 [Aspergillus granulosus]|uniref:Tc1-like transposase DDE domain-containing protein n=1 Tax=Aspergillus granulosus TaxID=176169 RepID=A0ABR4H2X1_9EURO
MAPRSELTPALRERICELHDAAKWGYKRIQKRYPFISVSTVRYTIKKDRERIGGVSKPRSGRPKKLDAADQEKLKRAIAENPKNTGEDVLAEVPHKMKYKPIHRLLNADNMRNGWVMKYRRFTLEDWAHVYWSDKCSVKRGIRTYIRSKNQSRGKQVKQMFGGAVCGDLRRTGLIRLFGNPRSERGSINCFVIEGRIVPSLIVHDNGIFQLDNAPSHTTTIVRGALDQIEIEKIHKLRPELLHMRKNDEIMDLLVATAQEAWNVLDRGT